MRQTAKNGGSVYGGGVWSADKKRKNSVNPSGLDEETVRGRAVSDPSTSTTQPEVNGEEMTEEYKTESLHDADFAEAELTRKASLAPVERFAAEHAEWREEIGMLGGTNSLLHFTDAHRDQIELSTTHPGGLPQFISGNKILLSALIRDDLALRQAKVGAGRVTDKAVEMRTERGLETVHLAIGIAKWEFEGDEFCAPVLLRPLAIRRYGSDFELKLKQRPFVNVALVRALQEQFGVRVDATELLQLSHSAGVFKPQPVIDRLRQVAAGVDGFTVQPRLVVSTFHDVAHELLTSLGELDHPVIDAVCGSETAQTQLAKSFGQATGTPIDERAPETDSHLSSADSQQEEVLAQVKAGNSIVVRTLPGTGGTQTVVNAIGALVNAGKRVLVVSPRRATLDGISYRLGRVGLPGLAASPRTLRRNLVESISRAENAKPGMNRDVDEALVRLRTVLTDYQGALVTPDRKLGVSPLDALHALSRLTRQDVVPTTAVRLDDEGLAQLALDRSAVAEDLTEVARLGQFEFGPEDSPWYGVSFTSRDQADEAYQLAVELAETELPRLTQMAGDVVSQTSMRPYNSVAELGIYLRLLSGIRETLDRFVPEVFDRSLTEIIAAHAPRGSDEMSGANRRRLKKLAREFVRPGVTVTDMYSRLVQIQQQRVLWQRYSEVVGARPEVPVGISDLVVAFQKTYQDLDRLDVVLDPEQQGERLRNMPMPDLAALMTELSRESEVLQNIQERTALVERLGQAHLSALLEDLSMRHVPASEVANELEQAWWQSALEYMLRTNESLLNANTSVIERLESDFRLVDDAHQRANGPTLAAQLGHAWKVAVLDHPAEAQALRQSLRAGEVTPTEISASAPHLLETLAPVWAVSPYEVPSLPRDLRFDTVLLVDASAMTFAESLSAVARAQQVVAFGDPVVQHPSPFTIGVSGAAAGAAGSAAAVHSGGSAKNAPASDPSAAAASSPQALFSRPAKAKGEPVAEEPETRSAFTDLAEVLPEFALTQSYRAGGADLIQLVNERFYQGKIASLPWAGTFLGHSSITHEFVEEGQGLPDREAGAVESPDGEVARVVQLVLRHASEHAQESLMVITASPVHAVRVQQAVLRAFAKFPEYRDFLLGERAEPFVVLTLEQAIAQSRDRVIFSVGYGRTPHGRVLSNFGSLTEPGGERLVAVAMTRARRAMSIVTSFMPEDLETTRVRHGLVELLDVLSAKITPSMPKVLPSERDPMLTELATELEALGLAVALDYQGMIPLAVAYNGKAIAIDLDADVREGSLRETLRLRPAVLRRLGWHYNRVHSFDLFANPAEVALRIAGTIGYEPQHTEEHNDTGQVNLTGTVSVAPAGAHTLAEPLPPAAPVESVSADLPGAAAANGVQGAPAGDAAADYDETGVIVSDDH